MREGDSAELRGVLDLREGLPWAQKPGMLRQLGFSVIERWLGYDQLDRRFTRARDRKTPGTYLRHLAEVFEFQVEVTGPGADALPKSGPVILVANHPFGGADAITVSDLGLSHRPDTRILSNEFLHAIDPLKPHLIPVDVYGGAEAKRKNLRGLREAHRHLAKGGQLVIFPAGEVASWSKDTRQVTEAPWPPHLGALAKRSRATVVPVFLPGENSRLFYRLGRLHPFLRTAWLGRELLRREGARIELRIGNAIDYDPESEPAAITGACREAVESLGELPTIS